MTRIVLVHGIGQQFKGPETLLHDWAPALRDGMHLAGCEASGVDDLVMAFYGDLFRPEGTRAVGLPELDAHDVDEGLERDLLLAWWAEAARVDPAVPDPDAKTRLRTPYVAQRALNALSHSAFFVGLAERAMVFDLKQIRRYLIEHNLREEIRARIARRVTADTRVVVGYSLGSVVAYEALAAHPEWPVRALITLGSPLGVRELIFDRLDPPPHGGKGCWPPCLTRWTNIADRGDVVALVKSLAPLFGPELVDVLIHNGAKAHDAKPYLTSKETGKAIADALST
jgi:pimeloyl-ACP methyl ester carboxylesterase